MLKALFKKQLLEIREIYTPKKYRGQKRKGSVGFIILYAFCLLSVAAAFVGMAELVCGPFHEMGLDWLYYLFFCFVALAVGIIGSVFSTYSTLYRAKDNELLLSMPIPPMKLLLVRMLSVFFMGFLFEAVVLLPAFGVHIYRCGTGVLNILGCLLGLISTGLVILALTCLLGWVVALVGSHTRKKSLVTVLVSLLLMGLYYFVYFRLNSLLRSLVDNAVTIGDKVSGNAYILKLIGMGFAGDAWGICVFALIALALTCLTVYLMSISFVRLTTMNRGEKKIAYVRRKMTRRSMLSALYAKELTRFGQSPTYLLNNILGVIIMLGGSVYVWIRFSAARELVNSLLAQAPQEWLRLLTIVPGVAVSFMCSMNAVTAPSISLEGSSLWVLKSLPVKLGRAFTAKQLLHFTVNLPAALVMCFTLCALLGLNAGQWLMNLLYAASYTAFSSALGLFMDLRKPHLDWTNESVAVKQSASVAIAMFGGWALIILSCLGAYFMRRVFNIAPLLFLVPALGALALDRWIYRRGPDVLMNI